MFSLTENDINISNLDFNNIILSKNYARPSKSLIDIIKYQEYKTIDIDLSLTDEFSYCKTNRYHYALIESLNKIKKNISDDFLQYIINEEIIFNDITIFDLDKYNILINLNSDYNIENIYNILYESKLNDIIIINYCELFNYPSIEILLLILNCFKKIKLFYCKIIKQNILIGINYKNNIIFNNFYNFIKDKNLNVRQIGIFFNTDIINKIYEFNNKIFNYHIIRNKLIQNIEIIDEKQYLFEHYKYIIKYNYKNNNQCNHNLFYSYFKMCYLCKNCSKIFYIN